MSRSGAERRLPAGHALLDAVLAGKAPALVERFARDVMPALAALTPAARRDP